MTEEATFKRLLVAGEDRDHIVAALEKAALIEHYTGAEVTVAQIVYDYIAETPDHYSDSRTAIIDRMIQTDQRALDDAVASFKAKVASLDTDVVWNKSTASGMLALAYAMFADLIIKPVTAGDALSDWVRTPTDWTLMREARCPVLFANTLQTWSAPRRVLASLDAGDEAHLDLNRKILSVARAFTNVLDAELHIGCVYPTLGQAFSEYQVANDFVGLKHEMKENREFAVANLCDETGAKPTKVHVVEGQPARTICELAAELRADITVLGTSARSGLGKLFIGNTAESIVHKLCGDVLTVRA